MTKSDKLQLVGFLCLIAGVIMFLMNIRAGGHYFGSNKAGWILLLMGIDFILMILNNNKIFKIIFLVLLGVLLISVILNIRVYLASMSIFKLFLIFGLTFGGIGLILKAKQV